MSNVKTIKMLLVDDDVSQLEILEELFDREAPGRISSLHLR